jgi:hypothetical protein
LFDFIALDANRLWTKHCTAAAAHPKSPANPVRQAIFERLVGDPRGWDGSMIEAEQRDLATP